MEPEIRPEPTQPERTALTRVLADLDLAPRAPGAGAWWRAGIREATDADGGVEPPRSVDGRPSMRFRVPDARNGAAPDAEAVDNT